MAHLPYTGGSNGNGITKVDELRNYLTTCPLALYDEGFMASYIPLIKTDLKLKRELLEADASNDGGSLWAKKLRDEKLVGWEQVAELDPVNDDEDLKTMADAMGLTFEAAEQMYRGKKGKKGKK